MSEELTVLREEIFGKMDMSRVITDGELEELIEQALLQRSRNRLISGNSTGERFLIP